MILEQLITGYLDGDLSTEQDRELRAHLTADPAARETFDAAVLIHIALRCEDRTVPPADLRELVFGSVNVMNQAHVARKPIRVGGRGVAVLAAIFLVFCLPLADSNLALFQVMPVMQMRVCEDVVPRSPKHRHSSGPVAVVEAETPEVVQVTAETTTRTADPEPLPTLSSLMLSNSETTTELTSTPQQTEPRTAEQPLPVVLSTAYAAGIGSTIPAATDIRQVSASIAYGVTNSGEVGLELGSTSYTVTKSIRLMSGASARTTIHRAGSEKFLSPEPTNADYTAETATATSSENQIWGTAFYQHTILELQSVLVSARVAAGVGEDGLLGYGRIVGEWKVGGIVSVVAGAETRTMPFRTGGAVGSATSTTYGTIITAVTGIHLRF